MGIEHILVDGYNILHQWAELKSARMKSLATGREALIQILTQFHDCRGGQMTLVFDGRADGSSGEKIRTSIQIVFSKKGQTADAVIERFVGQSSRPEVLLVATDDYAEQNIIESLGAQAISSEAFHAMVESELQDLKRVVEEASFKSRNFRKRAG